ncbi:amino acid adenylation domain-containing protein, partial [Seinonella peptonophila]|uniref:amino acid adenylation domain-containing protein n=1 Tax=Seinonella peptonophila TaxID=112248 RepID=UPI002481C02B
MDPEYPVERIQFMLSDSGARLVLSQASIMERLQSVGGESVQWLEVTSTEGMEAFNLSSINQSTDLAYVIYTSGTTGQPKGVMVEHRNVVRLLLNDASLFDFDQNDIWTLFHSYCFDFSVWEMYGALLYGGKLVIVPSQVTKEPKQFLELLRREKVTILNQTPSAFDHLAQQEMNHEESDLMVRKVIFGGEALSPRKLSHWKRKYPHTQLINMYGITEITVHATYKEITELEIESNVSNIGKPIPTLQTMVLDHNKNLVPIGVTGELYISGEGVARGYLNQRELTKERFIESPFVTGERMYRTGDLAYWLENGDLVYMGRIDQQVKVRGYRIEPGEIESALLEHAQVMDVTVRDWQTEAGDDCFLCAYVVSSQPIAVTELREHLRQKLPEYMIPSFFVAMEQIPLTSNGKVDRNALP